LLTFAPASIQCDTNITFCQLGAGGSQCDFSAFGRPGHLVVFVPNCAFRTAGRRLRGKTKNTKTFECVYFRPEFPAASWDSRFPRRKFIYVIKGNFENRSFGAWVGSAARLQRVGTRARMTGVYCHNQKTAVIKKVRNRFDAPWARIVS